MLNIWRQDNFRSLTQICGFDPFSRASDQLKRQVGSIELIFWLMEVRADLFHVLDRNNAQDTEKWTILYYNSPCDELWLV